MDSNSSTSTNACTRCQKPATLRCTACKDTPDRENKTESIYYCTSDCQKSDWKSHKKSCLRLRNRKTLYRAADLLQEIFYVYRERVFDKKVVKLKEKDGKLFVHHESHEFEGIIRTPTDILVPFPSSICRSVEDRHAVAAHLFCSDAVAWMHDIIKYMLEELASDITEIDVIPKNHKREVIAVALSGGDGPELYHHSIIKLNLKGTRESYALDLTGAQYGYYNPITPWQEYAEARVQSFLASGSPQYFGKLKDWHIRELERKEKGTLCLIVNLNMVASGALMGIIKYWEKDRKMTLGELLKLSLDKYRVQKGLFMAILACALKDILEERKKEDFKAREARLEAMATTHESVSES